MAWRRAIAIGSTALVASGAFWWLGVSKYRFPVPAYRAQRVVDGDTFETTDHQMIRLSGVDAPEFSLCGGPEAKAELEKLVLNQNLYLKVLYRDGFNRLISQVYNKSGLVGAQMLKKGMAFIGSSSGASPELKTAIEYARANKLGVHGVTCTQEKNLTNPNCVVKGNNSSRSKQYRFPGCGEYGNTLVQLSLGDQWFCTEKQAQAAGYIKGSDCFKQTWK